MTIAFAKSETVPEIHHKIRSDIRFGNSHPFYEGFNGKELTSETQVSVEKLRRSHILRLKCHRRLAVVLTPIVGKQTAFFL